MSLKSSAIKFATKKITKSKAGKKAIKTAVMSTALLGGSFIAYTLAMEGKKIEENKNKDE